MALVQEHPWEGRKLQVGDELYPGLPVILVPDLDSLHVVAALFDVDDGEIRGGETARCIADVHPGEVLDCRVREVAAVARETSWQSSRRAFRVIVDLPDRAAARRRLLPGMSMRVEAVVERRERARLVPRAALVFERESAALRTASGELEPVRVEACNAGDCVLGDGSAR
jgi:multidrug resistance efflux pump